MPNNVYILSHSSLDMVYVVKLYERYRKECNVRILVSSAPENLQFLRSINIPESALKYVYYESKANKSKSRNIWKYIKQLYRDKKVLNDLAREIIGDENNVLFFSSYNFDVQAGYLSYLVSRSNPVYFIDVLEIRPKRLEIQFLISVRGLKNLISLVLKSLIYGNIFILSGNKSYPHISLALDKFKLKEISRNSILHISNISKYKLQIPRHPTNVIFLYCNNHGIPYEQHISINEKIIKCLFQNNLNIYVKIHPQSQKPHFLDKYNISYIEKYIPFEFVDLSNVSIVVGLAGAALLCTGDTLTVSFVEMIYSKDSDYYISAMNQLGQNKDIIFIESIDQLAAILSELHPAVDGIDYRQIGKEHK